MKVEIIKGPGSCRKKVTINLDKYLTLIYGNNGSGKTILSDYFYLVQQERYRSQKGNFNDLEPITTANGAKVSDYDTNLRQSKYEFCVYNTSFIQHNFYQKRGDGIACIFTLGQDQVQAERTRDAATKEKEKLSNEKDKIEIEKGKITGRQETIKENWIERIWEEKKEIDNKRVELKPCIRGVAGSQDRFIAKFKETLLNVENNKTLDELQQEAKLLMGDEAEREATIKVPESNVSHIEGSPLFDKIIIGTEKSSLAVLIDKLNNSPWIRQGLDYVEHSEGLCPFCQQDMSEDLLQKIKDYFDEIYEKDITALENMETEYGQLLSAHISYKDRLIQLREKRLCTSDCMSTFRDLIDALEGNYNAIKDKIKEPNKKVKLQGTQELINTFMHAVEQTNKKIIFHNEEIKNRTTTRERIAREFWEIIRKKHNEYYERCKKEDEALIKEEKSLKRNIEDLQIKINNQDKIIQEARDKIVSVLPSIKNINKKLKAMGVVDFKLVEVNREDNTKCYAIQRNEADGGGQYPTLSEGEKTLITFLYFLETCQNSLSDLKQSHHAKRIIVVDDPISSLSNAYVFNIAGFIKEELLDDPSKKERYQNVVILTHSMYFFQVLRKRNKHQKPRLCYLRKTGEGITTIEPIRKNEMPTEYQFYWKIIRDYKKLSMSGYERFLPHAMRNILEYFFTFFANETNLKKIIGEGENDSFVSYMHGGSHSDSFDPFLAEDVKAIELDKWFRKFKQVFYDNKCGAHFEKMIKEDTK